MMACSNTDDCASCGGFVCGPRKTPVTDGPTVLVIVKSWNETEAVGEVTVTWKAGSVDG